MGLAGLAGPLLFGVGALISLLLSTLIVANLYDQYARLTNEGMPSDLARPALIRSRWRRSTTRVTLLLAVFVCAMAPVQPAEAASVVLAATTSVIGFDDLVTNGPGEGIGVIVGAQYAALGVTFNNPVALDYSKGPNPISGFAHSGSKAIEPQCYGVEFCTTPIAMTFATGHAHVKVWVGYSAALAQTQTVGLAAFDASGNQVATAARTIAPSARPQPIRLPLEVNTSSASIRKGLVAFGSGAITNHLAVDDVEFDAPGATSSPTPTPTPTVTRTPTPAPTVTRRIPVPDVGDMAEDQACGTVEKAKLRCTVNPTGSGPTPGTVTGQSPAPGTLVDPNSVVTLTVVRRIPVPDVRNIAKDQACTAIRHARLTCVADPAQGGSTPGQVVGQSPAPGTLVDDGTLVALQIRPEEQQTGVPGWVIIAMLALLVAAGAAAQQYRKRRPPHSPHIEVRLHPGSPQVRGDEAREW